MKKFLWSITIFLLCLLLFAACGGEEVTQPLTEGSTLPDSLPITTPKAEETTTLPSTATPKPVETSAHTETTTKAPVTTAVQTSEKPSIPTVPSPLCLNDMDKVAIKPIAFEKNNVFANDIYLTYVFNDNATDIDTTVLGGMANKTVYTAVRINSDLFRVDECKASGVYLYCNIEKAGAILLAGVTYSVAIEFYNSNDELLYYSRLEMLASTLNTVKTPERKPQTVTLPSSGITNIGVKQSALSASSIDVTKGSSLSYLFDGNSSVNKFSGTVQESIPTVYFSLNQATTLTHYTFTTANDAESYPERNPAGWRFYGKVGDMWMLISKIESSPNYETGLKAKNLTSYSYEIETPIECLEYKIEFIFTSSMMQLGDITLYATNGFSVPAPNPSAGTLLTGISGVQVALSDFRLIPDMQNHVGVAYYLSSTSSLAGDIKDGLTLGTMFAAITLDKTIYQISDFTISGNYILFDLQSAGAPVYSGITYQVSLGIYQSSGTRLYYTTSEPRSSTYQTPNLPARVGANITLPQNVTKVSVNTNSIKTDEAITHWGDGAAAQLFDGNTTTSKIGGAVVDGAFTLTFSLKSAATLTYYTFYTGNDTSTHPDRNPLGWILYGKVNGEYVVLSDVRENSVNVTGLEGVNATPYSYKIDNQQSCTEYMIVFYTNSMFQLNEMVLYKTK